MWTVSVRTWEISVVSASTHTNKQFYWFVYQPYWLPTTIRATGQLRQVLSTCLTNSPLFPLSLIDFLSDLIALRGPLLCAHGACPSNLLSLSFSLAPLLSFPICLSQSTLNQQHSRRLLVLLYLLLFPSFSSSQIWTACFGHSPDQTRQSAAKSQIHFLLPAVCRHCFPTVECPLISLLLFTFKTRRFCMAGRSFFAVFDCLMFAGHLRQNGSLFWLFLFYRTTNIWLAQF